MIENGKVQTYTLLYVKYISIKLKKNLIFKKELEKENGKVQLHAMSPGYLEEGT